MLLLFSQKELIRHGKYYEILAISGIIDPSRSERTSCRRDPANAHDTYIEHTVSRSSRKRGAESKRE